VRQRKLLLKLDFEHEWRLLLLATAAFFLLQTVGAELCFDNGEVNIGFHKISCFLR
jgi:hypothetical protein